MQYLAPWALGVCGAVLVVCWSPIAQPLRRIGKVFRCPACFGWWVGLGLGLAHFGPGAGLGWLELPVDAFGASAWAMFAILVLRRLGLDET
jgi:hypothetical protein